MPIDNQHFRSKLAGRIAGDLLRAVLQYRIQTLGSVALVGAAKLSRDADAAGPEAPCR